MSDDFGGSDSSSLKWVTLFDNQNAKTGKKGKGGGGGAGDQLAMEMDAIENLPSPGGKPTGGKKRLSVERIYQKKTQLEHILLRPDTYIGSVETVTQPMWVMDEETSTMVQRELTYVPGLYKIFDEILVNAADNKIRDAKMDTIKIDINPEDNKVKIWNNGKGIPVVEHKEEKIFVPSLIFGHLLTSSNYNDEDKKVTGGRNGYGAKLCNIFSTKFIVETSCRESRKYFKQSWTANMTKTTDSKISPNKEDDFTAVTFYPDLSKFKMDKLDDDIVALFKRRAYDIAGTRNGVKVYLNGKRLPVKNFKDYVNLFVKDKTDDNGQPLKVSHEQVNDRWEVAITLSEKGFQQASFVNSIATTKGGRHVDYIADQVVNKLMDTVKKKNKGGAINIKPFQIRTHIWVFVNCLIENPTFDSQTKENMTLQVKGFGSKCVLGEKFITQTNKCGIVEAILSWLKFKTQEKMNKKCHGTKHSKLKGIPKLDDANNAGTKNSLDCTLILTEGDSAKTLAVAGLGVIGRDNYGVFPLRGKLLNVREATHKQIMENAEINNIIKIMGLQYKSKYEESETLKTLRYGKLMIMTDQDQDGSHIKGLLVNFIHHNWPNLLKHRFLVEFITPIVKVSKKNDEKSFYSLPEFEEWKRETDNWHTYKVKYYKGLGTSTSKEAKEYFSDMERHRIPFKYIGTEDDASIQLAFSKKKVDERKEWLTNWMEERKRRTQLGLPELYLYGKETKHITYNEFINRELILFSNADNERSIPSLVDGLKPGQRKVLYACFKRNLVKEMKVAQLAGSIAELSAYHHGEISLMGTIINLAQNFVGSNNVNLLQPIGQFGTRLHGGKDAASPRYIFTALSPLTRLAFIKDDEALLRFNYDDNQRIEPEWYIPILPMVLVNGTDGIGTGWSTKIPNYDVREIVSNLRSMLDGREPVTMLPSFKNFRGTIEKLDDFRFVVNGEVSIVDDQTIEITELPIRSWTQAYKETVLEPMLMGTDKQPALINDYKEYHTDTRVKFVVKMSQEKLAKAEEAGLHKVFKLQTTISTSTMVLFDGSGVIRRYSDANDILREFYTLRLEYYRRRKDFLEGMLAAESLKLDNQARFIMEKIEGKITIENKPKKELIQILVRRGYDSDPVKAWKKAQDKLQEEDSEEGVEEVGDGPDYNYILGMALWCLTKEKKEELCKQRDAKADELRQLRRKEPEDLWRNDLNTFLTELDKVEEQERLDENTTITKNVKTAKGRKTVKKIAMEDSMPSPMGRRVEPRIDPALRQKSEAAAKKLLKMKEKKEKAVEMDFLMDDEDTNTSETKSLADRLGGGLKKTAAAVKSPSKPKKEPKEPAEKKPRAKKASGGKEKADKKGGKKKNPWSDSEEENLDESDLSGMEMDSQDTSIPRVNFSPRRAAAKKVKYTFSSDEEGEKDEEEVFKDNHAVIGDNFTPTVHSGSESEPEDDYVASSPVRKSKPAAAPITFTDSEDDSPPSTVFKNGSQDSMPVTFSMGSEDDAPKKPAPKPKAPPKKRALGDKPSKPAAAKKDKKDPKQPSIFSAFSTASSASSTTASTRPPVSSVILDDSDSDLDIIPAPPSVTSTAPSSAMSSQDLFDSILPKATAATAKKEAPKKKAAPKKKKLDSDDDEDSFNPKPKKAPPKKRAKKAVDSDEDNDDFMPKKKSTAAKKGGKKKKVMSDSEDDMDFNDDDAEVSVAPKARAGRARATVKYNFGEDDDADSDF